MGHSRRLLAFKMTNTALDHWMNHLGEGELDVTIEEFYSIIVAHSRPAIYLVVYMGVGFHLVAFWSILNCRLVAAFSSVMLSHQR